MRKKKDSDYYINQHSCFLLTYDLILTTLNFKNIIEGPLKKKLLNYTQQYFQDRDLKLLGLTIETNSMHVVFDACPNLNLAQFVNAFKSASSRQMRKIMAKEREMSNDNANTLFWNRSYFLCSHNEKSEELIVLYIENQNTTEGRK